MNVSCLIFIRNCVYARIMQSLKVCIFIPQSGFFPGPNAQAASVCAIVGTLDESGQRPTQA